MRDLFSAGIFFSTMMRLASAGNANAAGSKPIMELGQAIFTSRKTRRNCAGPASAAAAHGKVLSANFRRNRNGNSANAAKKIRYQASGVVGGTFELVMSKRWKCQAHSTAKVLMSPTSGIHSNEKIFVRPSSSATSSSARPNTGVGLASGTAKVSGVLRSSPIFSPFLKTSGLNFRTSHTLATTKKTANAPSRKNEVGKPVRSAGILKMSAPVAASVRSSTASTGSKVAVITASTMASRSTSSTNGQTRNDNSASLKIGTSTSNSASGGKK